MHDELFEELRTRNASKEGGHDGIVGQEGVLLKMSRGEVVGVMAHGFRKK